MLKMASNSTKSLKQLSFLQKLLENKHILFGKYSASLNRSLKQAKWVEIRDFAVSTGIITNDKTFTFVRDVTWGNLRKRTMTKVDNMKKTGTGGGLDSKLTEIDELVLQIIGKDSPVIDGLGVADSFQEESQGEEISIEPLGGEEVTMKSDINECASFQGPVKSKKRVVVVNNEEDKTNIQHLKKLKLEMEQIKMHTVESQLRQHKLKLEILEKEKMLNIPSSQFTKVIAASEFPKYDSQCCFESVQEIVLLNNN